MTIMEIISKDHMKNNHMKVTKQSTVIKRSFACTIIVCALAGFNSTASAVVEEGNPYVPAGADFQIFALQGIDSSNPTGQSSFSPQVNLDDEFADGIGVSYDAGSSGGKGGKGGGLTDFGL